jgi:hypothetical protein
LSPEQQFPFCQTARVYIYTRPHIRTDRGNGQASGSAIKTSVQGTVHGTPISSFLVTCLLAHVYVENSFSCSLMNT